MRAGSGRRTALTLLLLAAMTLPFFYRLGAWPLFDPDEGRNAEVAREMAASGQWAVPRFDGQPYLDKPVLLFWAVAAVFRLRGVGEASARLPSALAAVATTALTLASARLLLGPAQGLLAASIVATSPLVLAFARLVIFDMLLTALVTAALYCLLRARLGGAPARWLPAAGAAMGLATLTKGPVGIAVPLLGWHGGRGRWTSPWGGSWQRRWSRRGSRASSAASLAFSATRSSTRRGSVSPRAHAFIAGGPPITTSKPSPGRSARVSCAAGARAAPTRRPSRLPRAARPPWSSSSRSRRPSGPTTSCRSSCSSAYSARRPSPARPPEPRRRCAPLPAGWSSPAWRASWQRGTAFTFGAANSSS